jgi:hypothetical protein
MKFDPDSGIMDVAESNPTTPVSWGVPDKYHFRPAVAKQNMRFASLDEELS